MTEIQFYDLPGCPYCLKVRRKLDELDLDYETHEVSRPYAERTEVQKLTGQPRVPVIVDEAHGIDGMHESADIVAYLEATYGEDAENR